MILQIPPHAVNYENVQEHIGHFHLLTFCVHVDTVFAMRIFSNLKMISNDLKRMILLTFKDTGQSK